MTIRLQKILLPTDFSNYSAARMVKKVSRPITDGYNGT